MENSRERLMMVVGFVGIVSLLAISLGFALQESAASFETGHVNQFAQDQQSVDAESAR